MSRTLFSFVGYGSATLLVNGRRNDSSALTMKLKSQLRLGLALALAAVVRIAAGQSGVRYVSNSGSARDVVVVAHQDDWQLFMGDVIAERIRAGDSVTFIYLTAGDDGRDSTYWQSRERAALESTRIAAGPTRTGATEPTCSRVNVLGHLIRRCEVSNAASYFLRLPDGKRSGSGFAVHSYQSLRKLRGKTISAISAVDQSATYFGWEDLKSTLTELVERSVAGRAEEIVIHSSDPNIAVNPHDHLDHRLAGLLVADVNKKQNWKTRYYVGYALAMRAANRSTEEARQKTAVFLAYDGEMMRINREWSAYREHPAFYSECMLRTYVRTSKVR